jgi:hypothetical protein
MKTSSWGRRLSRLSALAALLAAAVILPSAAGGEDGVATLATGSGQTTVAGELRTFSFTAQMHADGSTTGVAQVNNRAIDEMFELRLDCLRAFGNTAIVSGVITRHTDPHALGLTGIFAVVDSGEGAVASESDLITQVFFFRPNTLTCGDLVPADATPFLVPVEAGNVQVH